LLHQFISGNKLRKLKYNLQLIKEKNIQTIITFGGAFSNHIAATAFAGFENNIKTVGIIRGEELKSSYKKNPTLSFAERHGMTFEFISRPNYQKRTDPLFLETIQNKYPNSFILPEGGSNLLAIKGCEEILADDDQEFDYFCCAIGTSITIQGIIKSSFKHQKTIGFPALKGVNFDEILNENCSNKNFEICNDYHFGGYAKVTDQLIDFINGFKHQYQIPLDPVYTAKMMFGILDKIKNNYFAPNSKILAIHTGGLQGIAGMNQYLTKRNKTTIVV
jgi:1-aminocyclopropane-1-carboxylate deaminase